MNRYGVGERGREGKRSEEKRRKEKRREEKRREEKRREEKRTADIDEINSKEEERKRQNKVVDRLFDLRLNQMEKDKVHTTRLFNIIASSYPTTPSTAPNDYSEGSYPAASTAQDEYPHRPSQPAGPSSHPPSSPSPS